VGASAQEEEEEEYDETVTVERIVDGDTIRIDPAVDDVDEVRLIGIDTPETKDPDCDVQPYGPEALVFTRDQLQGQEVELEFDEDREDRYERLLAYVYLDDDMFNETLLEEGYAQVYTVSPNDKYEDRFEAAQEAAQEAEIGIWGLSSSEHDLLADRDNGIGGGEECSSMASPTPPPPPPPAPTPPPEPSEPDAPEPDVAEPDVPEPVIPTPEVPPSPPQSAAPAPSKGDVDCPDFSTSAEAQVYLLPGDPHRLDADNDGQACDSLP
jgi:micrococcal nuclease